MRLRLRFAALCLSAAACILATAHAVAQAPAAQSSSPEEEAPPRKSKKSRAARPSQAPQPSSPALTSAAEAAKRDRLNAWTVGLAGGPLEGEPIRYAAEIARAVDDGDKLYVLPIVTRGAAENIEAIMFLRGVDAAIINTDALEGFKARMPDIQQRITYILNLFPSELHILARPEIRTLADLNGKKVNFNTAGTGAAYSGPLMFDHLKLDVLKSFIPNAVALEQMRSGRNDMAAVVFVAAKPVDTFLRGSWPPGFHFLPADMNDYGFYLPSTLTAADYPNLIQPGQDVPTIAVPTVLASYNWPLNSDRYNRVARLTSYLFDRLTRLQEPGFHPKWKDINVNAQVPGMIRYPAAQEWMLRQQVQALMEAARQADTKAPQASAAEAKQANPKPAP